MGYDTTIKELDKNLVDKNVMDMLPAGSITNDMMKMSLGYLMFLKRKRCGKKMVWKDQSQRLRRR